MLVPQLASGQSVGGFPIWEERVILEWSNRARSDPQFEMTQCGPARCTEGACYTRKPPFGYSLAANRSARFHADYMQIAGGGPALQHDTNCTGASESADCLRNSGSGATIA